MAHVYLGLGSNLGDRNKNLSDAVLALSRFGRVAALSSLYETAPLYVIDQPAFLNMAVFLDTDLAPLPLLAALKNLESELGRVDGIRFGPRHIDLDILFHDDCRLSHPDLEIPHPRLHERRFALTPLAEIAPDLVHPVLGRTIRELLDGLTDTDPVTQVALPFTFPDLG